MTKNNKGGLMLAVLAILAVCVANYLELKPVVPADWITFWLVIGMGLFGVFMIAQE